MKKLDKFKCMALGKSLEPVIPANLILLTSLRVLIFANDPM